MTTESKQALQKPRTEANFALMVGAGLLSFLAVYLTGGKTSSLQSLLFLPIIMAIARGWMMEVLGMGLMISVLYLFALPRHDTFDLTQADFLRVGTADLMLLVAAYYAHRVRQEQEHLRGLADLAYTDSLTTLNNHRAFRDSLGEEFKRAARYDHPLSLILLDLDGFKQINDRYGHPAGDTLLASVGAILRANVREIDVAARYGGEEFAIVCPETTAEDAQSVAERIRRAVETAKFPVPDDDFCRMTCSVGIATYPQNAPDDNALLAAADDALYCAKRTGKNAVRSAKTF